ncbi:hypothetical protein Aperf_G00000035033 [Anoplocephala perfoliata]
MALVEYSSSDSDEESHEKGSLVLPPFTCDIKGDTVRFLEPSKSSESTGLVRSFAHQHGNWATSVYLPATEALTRFLYTLMDLVKPLLSQSNREFYICEEFHLSLSRTWPILHHWIAGFERMLHDISTKYPRPFVKLEKADFLVNDEGTRCLCRKVRFLCKSLERTILQGPNISFQSFVVHWECQQYRFSRLERSLSDVSEQLPSVSFTFRRI